ncbi:MoaD/ThiS family protein [Pedobacter psychroterrae]|uniref:MoaD/ThiS family protein n=1 Tax=Pedobacter psychroterrae TaxID=2530453 RepID=A0A4R0NU15_9SPHI|nr:MoaD/ThiS family protein [Pedobacter psychroterrae]TCD02524.1 MoaD/ThiS family protein [Pedobacter psychroterrae]
MEIQLISFGKISEFLHSQQLEIEGISDTDQLKAYLESNFLQLADLKYKLAVNKILIQENTHLNSGDSVAVMPPFSGG